MYDGCHSRSRASVNTYPILSHPSLRFWHGEVSRALRIEYHPSICPPVHRHVPQCSRFHSGHLQFVSVTHLPIFLPSNPTSSAQPRYPRIRHAPNFTKSRSTNLNLATEAIANPSRAFSREYNVAMKYLGMSFSRSWWGKVTTTIESESGCILYHTTHPRTPHFSPSYFWSHHLASPNFCWGRSTPRGNELGSASPETSVPLPIT